MKSIRNTLVGSAVAAGLTFVTIFVSADPGDIFLLRDFAQVREGLPETDGGTPGGAYCGPTSSMDVLQWLNENGYPGLGVDDPTDAGAVTDMILSLGDEMETDPNGGTGSQRIVNVLQSRLDFLYPGQFTVKFVGRSSNRVDLWSTGHNFSYVTSHLDMYDLVLVNVGWYAASGERCSGHWIAMRGYDREGWPAFMVSRYSDPARENGLSHKVVTYEQIDLEDKDGIVREQWASSWNWMRNPGSCDLGPRKGVQDNVITIGGVMLFSHASSVAKFVSYNLARDDTLYHAVTGTGTPTALAHHPFLKVIYFCNPLDNSIYRTDLVTNEVTPFTVGTPLDQPRRLEFSSNCILYVLQGSPGAYSVVALDPGGNLLGQVTNPGLSAIAYYEKLDQVLLWDGPASQVQAFTDTLTALGPPITLPSGPAFAAPGYITADPTGDILYYNHDGSSLIFRYDLATHTSLNPISDTEMVDPAAMVLDNRGHLYVAPGTGGPVLEFDSDGWRVTGSLAGNLEATGLLAINRAPRRPLNENYTGGNTNADRPIDLGDFNGDLEVNTDDYTQFEACFSGPEVPCTHGCEPGDFDSDLDIDCSDWDQFELAWTDTLSTPPSLPQCGATAVTEKPGAEFRLNPCYPNPFNPQTTISYFLSDAGEVLLTIHDTRGRLVATLVSEAQQPGNHAITWDGKDRFGQRTASGVYFVRLESRKVFRTQKLVLLK